MQYLFLISLLFSPISSVFRSGCFYIVQHDSIPSKKLGLFKKCLNEQIRRKSIDVALNGCFNFNTSLSEIESRAIKCAIFSLKDTHFEKSILWETYEKCRTFARKTIMSHFSEELIKKHVK
ncbi:unnamed protein product [Caenorhabditis angaria]|uniref:Uncharacterized protein n=1 Tax=Caenorhabditis angaria TaxID=860376 RepID=A0A9P1N015_9PELO|nr:unnamed protein product [Caenorhabditis angaria]